MFSFVMLTYEGWRRSLEGSLEGFLTGALKLKALVDLIRLLASCILDSAIGDRLLACLDGFLKLDDEMMVLYLSVAYRLLLLMNSS